MLIKVNYCDYNSFSRVNRISDGVKSYISDYIPRVDESLYFDTIGHRVVSSVKYHIEDDKLSYVELDTYVKGID